VDDTSKLPNWRLIGGIFLAVLLLNGIAVSCGWNKPRGLKGLCAYLFWPESSVPRHKLYGHLSRLSDRMPETLLGSGDVAYGRAQVTPAAWAGAPGLGEAAHWPGVVFEASQVSLLQQGTVMARVIRARAGNRMGLWIFANSGSDERSNTYVGHPGGNSGTPFQTIFIRWAGEMVALNVLRLPDRRLEQFVFRLNESQPVCRELSDR